MIWDFNIRIFHFLLIILMLCSIISSKLNYIFLHQYFGVTFLGLIIFRIYWGFYGSYYSRFKNFNCSPYFTHTEIMNMIADLEAGNGFWDRTASELTQMANTIQTTAGL